MADLAAARERADLVIEHGDEFADDEYALAAAYLELTAKLEASRAVNAVLRTDADQNCTRATTAESALAKVFEDTRERCAKVCLDWPDEFIPNSHTMQIAEKLSKAIRALYAKETAAQVISQGERNGGAYDMNSEEYGYGQFMTNAFGRAGSPAAALPLETPRTDAQKWYRQTHDRYGLTQIITVDREFARQLERDLIRLRTGIQAIYGYSGSQGTRNMCKELLEGK